MKAFLTAGDHTELDRLFREFERASEQARVARRRHGAGSPQLDEADAAVRAVWERIQAVRRSGDTEPPDDAAIA